jgi:hypothetical protein
MVEAAKVALGACKKLAKATPGLLEIYGFALGDACWGSFASGSATATAAGKGYKQSFPFQNTYRPAFAQLLLRKIFISASALPTCAAHIKR